MLHTFTWKPFGRSGTICDSKSPKRELIIWPYDCWLYWLYDRWGDLGRLRTTTLLSESSISVSKAGSLETTALDVTGGDDDFRLFNLYITVMKCLSGVWWMGGLTLLITRLRILKLAAQYSSFETEDQLLTFADHEVEAYEQEIIRIDIVLSSAVSVDYAESMLVWDSRESTLRDWMHCDDSDGHVSNSDNAKRSATSHLVNIPVSTAWSIKLVTSVFVLYSWGRVQLIRNRYCLWVHNTLRSPKCVTGAGRSRVWPQSACLSRPRRQAPNCRRTISQSVRRNIAGWHVIRIHTFNSTSCVKAGSRKPLMVYAIRRKGESEWEKKNAQWSIGTYLMQDLQRVFSRLWNSSDNLLTHLCPGQH